mmetsp:Transcript_27674/g.49933  ORF Transcript_27674/g.49933 Transcript_27674/m.49933 type:complete len:93 (-) Transcript_27674:152-430(-)
MVRLRLENDAVEPHKQKNAGEHDKCAALLVLKLILRLSNAGKCPAPCLSATPDFLCMKHAPQKFAGRIYKKTTPSPATNMDKIVCKIYFGAV